MKHKNRKKGLYRTNIGTVKMTMETNGFPKGLILKRELTLRECKYILFQLLGIELQTREDFEFYEEYKDAMNNYRETVNAWLKGEADDDSIAEFAFDCSDEQLGLMNMIPIVAYLKKKGVID